MLPVFGSRRFLAGIVDPKAPAIRLLATPPMVWIGLVSYSWYLWHWPLLALGVSTISASGACHRHRFALLSLCLAATTYYFLERPIRRWRQGRGKEPGWQSGWRPVFLGVAVAVVAAIGGFQIAQAYARHYDSIVASIYAPVSKGKGRSCDLMTATAEDCLAMANGRSLGLLIGDSQMMYATNALALDAEAVAFVVSATSPGCGAFLQTRLFQGDANADARCERTRKRVSCTVERNYQARLCNSIFVVAEVWTRRHARLARLWDSRQQIRPRPSSRASAEPSRNSVPWCTTDIDHRPDADLSALCSRLPFPRRPLQPRSGNGLRPFAGRSGRHATTSGSAADYSWHVGIDGVRFVDPTDNFCDALRCLPYSVNDVFFVDLHHPGDTAINKIMSTHPADFDWVTAAP